MVLPSAAARRPARKKNVEALISALKSEFVEVEDTLVNDASPETWECVSVAVYVTATPEKYYPTVYESRTGMVIEENLQSFAPRLYNFIRDASEVSAIEVQLRPSRVEDHPNEDLYDGNMYLIDVWYP